MTDSALVFGSDIPCCNGVEVIGNPIDALSQCDLISRATLMAIDTESQPSFGGVWHPVSLLQVALVLDGSKKNVKKKNVKEGGNAKYGEEKVLLFDCLSLGATSEGIRGMNEVLRVLRKRGTKDGVPLVGHGLHNDFSILFFSYPACTELRKSWGGVLEIVDAHRQIAPGDGKRTAGLRELCLHYLHSHLSKRLQCSDWGSRPLTLAQRYYASCDVLVLLRLYNAVLAECFDTLGLSFDWRSLQKTVVPSAVSMDQPKVSISRTKRKCWDDSSSTTHCSKTIRRRQFHPSSNSPVSTKTSPMLKVYLLSMEVCTHSEVSRMERGERETGGVHSVHFNCLSSNWDAAEFTDNTPQSLASNCDYTPKCLDGDSGSSILKSVFVPTPTNGGEELDPTLVAELPCQAAPTTDSVRCIIAGGISNYSSSRNINVKDDAAAMTDRLMEITKSRSNRLDATVMDNPLIRPASSSSKAVNRLKRREHEVKTYLTAYVYPILLDAIVHLLYNGPGDVKQVLHKYLMEKKEGLEGFQLLRTNQKGANNVMDKTFMDLQIVPVTTKLIHAAIIRRSSGLTELFLDELKQMIDEEEEEEGLGEDDGSVTSTRDRKLTPSVRRKLSEALSYSHENFKKPEVIDRSSSSALEGCKNEEEVQQAYVGAENKDDKALLSSSTCADETKPISSAMQIMTTSERVVCILLLGLDGAGKTTLSRVMHGELNPKTVPTVGFKPSRLNLGQNEQTNLEVGKLLLHDIGGGPKIRGIWENYYHDCHAVIFCVDSSNESRWKEASTLFNNCITHKYLRDKPILVVYTKADAGVVVNENRASEELGLTAHTESSAVCCSLLSGDGIRPDNDETEELMAPDSRLQEGLTWLLSKVVVQWDVLSKRVVADMDEVEKKFYAEKEKKKIAVLGQVILKAFSSENGSSDSLPEDVFQETDGLNFLALEIGENGGSSCLPSEAIEAAKLVGYQKLALQMVGNMKVPVNKKISPMEWEMILNLLNTIRKDVGLDSTSIITHDEDKFSNPSQEEEEAECDDQPISISTHNTSTLSDEDKFPS